MKWRHNQSKSDKIEQVLCEPVFHIENCYFTVFKVYIIYEKMALGFFETGVSKLKMGFSKRKIILKTRFFQQISGNTNF